MIALLAGFTILGFGIWDSPQLQDPDATALAVALAHARTVIPEGAIHVSSDSLSYAVVDRAAGSRSPEPSMLEAAAGVAGFAFGPDAEAVDCSENGYCRPLG